ncbi:Sap, sulfolipid-1-addressing protein [Micromonospora pattaloongensis]|uniref:Sap, sulfolipid-1-addressing protein n=1 Tax=Micromonospora pattaloongensis TaxID=405436 RepID=A0A1H3QRW8_9ACTN|nr:GAP family protein [Micromonospora pattaloongensis]SDZ16090.1 Sap, sulfolipid-1-addressing protein [Micromonospora pattaloongensis]
MSGGLLLSLVALAIVDSTSIGTLFIPVWLLLAPGRIGVGRFLGYLATIAAFYFVVGAVLTLGGVGVAGALDDVTASRWLLFAQLAVGLALFALSFWVEARRNRATAAILRLRDRAPAGAAGSGGLVGLALMAALAEVATMLPYLGAIGMMTTAELSWWLLLPLLAGYCVVMVLPALALLALRLVGRGWIDTVLQRMNAWVVAKGSGVLSWVLGIAGFLVARDAAARLWFPQLLGGA